MMCSHCMKEYGNDVQVCPQCGGTLAYGAPPAATGGFDPNAYVPGPQERQMNLGTTVSVSGSTSIRGRLRPRNVFEIIGEAFSLYKENWKLFAMVVLVFTVPAMIFELGWQGEYCKFMGQVGLHKTPDNVGPFVIWTALFVVSAYGALFLTNYSLTRAVSDIYLGKMVEFREIIRPNNRFWGFVGASLVCGVIMMAVMMVCILPMVCGFVAMAAHRASPQPADAFFVLIGMLGTLFGCFFVLPAIAVWFVAVAPAAVIEGKGSFGAIVRGMSLVRGFYWKAAGLLILATLIYLIIDIIITSPHMMTTWSDAANQIHQMKEAHSHGMQITPYSPSIPVLGLGVVLGLLGSCVTMPLLILPIVLFYYDLRIRKEGFDLQMLAEQLGYGVGSEPVLSR